MSEVTRYLAPALIDGRNVMKSAEGFSVVSAAHYDAAQSELAALREELGDLKSSVSTWRIAYDRRTSECDELKQRLAEVQNFIEEK